MLSMIPINSHGKDGVMATRSSIQEERAEYRKREYKTFPVIFRDQTFTCFVLPQAMCPELPNFAYFRVAEDRENAEPDAASIFAVSDSMPEKFRVIAVYHEICEYWYGCTCGTAAEHEIAFLRDSFLTPADIAEYLLLRQAFFRVLIPFAIEHKYPPEKIAEFKASQDVFDAAVAES